MKTLLSLLLVAFTLTAHAQISRVTVKEVYDAQILRAYSDEYQDEFNVLLIGMTAPGIDQPYGKEARDYVAKQVLGKTVKVEPFDAGEYGLAALIYNEEGKNITEELIRMGYAQADERETPWVKLEEEARSKKLGIWKDGTPVDLTKDWAEHHKLKQRIEEMKQMEAAEQHQD